MLFILIHKHVLHTNEPNKTLGIFPRTIMEQLEQYTYATDELS